MTCQLVEPGVARFTRRGRIVIGSDEGAGLLRSAGFDVGVSADIAADKWLKLFCNLSSTLHAVVRGADHARPEFGEAKRLLLTEARALFEHNGIPARSCDGRDAGLDEEIERQSGPGGRARPVYNDTWRCLSRGRTPLERYHDVIASLGPAPRNAAMQRLVDAATGPECYALDEVLATLRGAR